MGLDKSNYNRLIINGTKLGVRLGGIAPFLFRATSEAPAMASLRCKSKGITKADSLALPKKEILMKFDDAVRETRTLPTCAV